MNLSKAQKLMFAPVIGEIRAVLADLTFKKPLPGSQSLNAHFNAINQKGLKLQFVDQDHNLPHPEMGYEDRIYKTGLIATRKNNWHDFFNAMVWKIFSQLKSCLNAIHFQEQKLQTSSLRSRRRDWLTLFDENGVILIADEEVRTMVQSHDWNSLFVEHAELWHTQQIQVITFGHALYEKYLNPYIGMTAHSLFVCRDEEDIEQSLIDKISNDRLLVKKSDLLPLPLLGIPGWHTPQDQEFYANTGYFRQ